MDINNLNNIIERHGFILVQDARCFHAFKPEDIDQYRVKDDRSPVCSFSAFELATIPSQEADDFIERCKHVPSKNKYDTSQKHIIPSKMGKENYV